MERKWTSCLRKKGFEDFFKEADADIFCVQETKLQEGQIDFAPEGYECYWNYAEKKRLLWHSRIYEETPIKSVEWNRMEEHDQKAELSH